MSLQYQDDYYGDNNRDGNSTDLIDQRRKTQAEKDAAKGMYSYVFIEGSNLWVKGSNKVIP